MNKGYVIVFLLLTLSSCGGANSSGTITGDSAATDFTDYTGFWYMNNISLNGQGVIHVDLSQSIEITTTSLKITDYTQGCSAVQTFELQDGLIASDTPTVTCPDGACTLNYTLYDPFTGNLTNSSLACPTDFPAVLAGKTDATALDSSTVQIKTTYPGGDELTLQYLKLSGHTSSSGGSLASFLTNGTDRFNQLSYLDCTDATGPSQISLYDDFTGELTNSNGTFDINWWRDTSGGLLNLVISFYGEDWALYYYADSIHLDGSGYIDSARFYTSSSSGSSSAMVSGTHAAVYSGNTITCTKI